MVRADRVGWGIGRAAAMVFSLMVLAACVSSRDDIDNPPSPASTGVVQADVALELLDGVADPDRLEVELSLAATLAGAGRIEAALAILRALRVERRSAALTEVEAARVAAAHAVAWNRVAARDQTQAERADEVSVAALRQLAGARLQPWQAPLLVTLLDALATNENATEASIRRAIDEIYLAGDPVARVGALVDAGDLIAREGLSTALNPILQQAIASSAAVNDPVEAIIIDSRLAALAVLARRPTDRDALIARMRRRADSISQTPAVSVARLARLAATLVELNEVSLAMHMLNRLADGATRAEVYAELAIVAAREGRPELVSSALALGRTSMAQVADPARRMVAEARMLFSARAAYGGVRSPARAAAEVAAGNVVLPSGRIVAIATPSSIAPHRRQEALAWLVAAALVVDRGDEAARLQSLYAGEVEYREVHIEATRLLLELGDRDGAAVALGMATGDVGEESELRRARAWIELGNTEAAAVSLALLDPLEAARTLASLPPEVILTDGEVDALRSLVVRDR